MGRVRSLSRLARSALNRQREQQRTEQENVVSYVLGQNLIVHLFIHSRTFVLISTEQTTRRLEQCPLDRCDQSAVVWLQCPAP